MICDTFYAEAEYAYKIRATLHKEPNPDKDSLTYLPVKLREFCDKTGVSPEEVFKRSRVPRIVMYKIAFVHTLPNNYSPSKIGRFLNYDHSTVINWKKKHDEFYMNYEEYRELINKLT